MGKYYKSILFLICALSCVFFNRVNTYAMEIDGDYLTESDGNLLILPPDESAVLINHNVTYKDSQTVTTNVYILPDGSTIVDTIQHNFVEFYSKEGSDTVTRTKTLNGWGSLTITASFDWYTKGMFSYVRCSSMTAYFTPNNSHGTVTYDISTSYTSKYVAIGKASATANCTLSRHYTGELEMNYLSFSIECSDEGTISDH